MNYFVKFSRNDLLIIEIISVKFYHKIQLVMILMVLVWFTWFLAILVMVQFTYLKIKTPNYTVVGKITYIKFRF